MCGPGVTGSATPPNSAGRSSTWRRTAIKGSPGSQVVFELALWRHTWTIGTADPDGIDTGFVTSAWDPGGPGRRRDTLRRDLDPSTHKVRRKRIWGPGYRFRWCRERQRRGSRDPDGEARQGIGNAETPAPKSVVLVPEVAGASGVTVVTKKAPEVPATVIVPARPIGSVMPSPDPPWAVHGRVSGGCPR